MQNGASTPGNRSKTNGARFSLPDSPVHDQSYVDHDDFGGGEASVAHPLKDLVGTVGWLWDSQIGCNARDVRATRKELKARTTGTVGDSDGTSKLNAMS